MRFRIGLTEVGRGLLTVRLDVEIVPHHGADPTNSDASEMVFLLPTWTPGSYLVREYSRHLSDVRAQDPETGESLAVRKVRKNRYAVAGTGAAIRLEYTVYARELSVRTAFATHDWAFWNGACVLLWPLDAASRSAVVDVELPVGWRLITGKGDAEVRDGVASFPLDDQDDAIDTPCLAGPLTTWEFVSNEREHRIVAAGLGPIVPPPSFVGDVKRVVEVTASLFGGPLPFPRYELLALFGETGRGGLEHRDCCTLLAPRTTFAPQSSYEDFLALCAHEYLHAWNVKRLRPLEFHAYDYEIETYSRLLWVAEGFTSYYDDLMVRRAGLMGATRYLEQVARHITGFLDNPGRLSQSLSEASFDAWIRLYRPDENTRNVTQSYYGNGAIVALVLDATIRRSTDGARSLDDAMRALWQHTAGGERGYSYEDVVRCISTIAEVDLGALIQSMVERPLDPDLTTALQTFGLTVSRGPETAWLGVRLELGGTTFAVVQRDGPAAAGGLRAGDEVLAIDGLRTRESSWDDITRNRLTIGRPARMLIAREGRIHEVEVTPASHPSSGLRIVAADPVTTSQLDHREAWLGVRSLDRSG